MCGILSAEEQGHAFFCLAREVQAKARTQTIGKRQVSNPPATPAGELVMREVRRAKHTVSSLFGTQFGSSLNGTNDLDTHDVTTKVSRK